jgi:hypothetical protein
MTASEFAALSLEEQGLLRVVAQMWLDAHRSELNPRLTDDAVIDAVIQLIDGEEWPAIMDRLIERVRQRTN